MKKLFIAALSVILVFAACKKDDDAIGSDNRQGRPHPERPDGPGIPDVGHSPLVQIIDSSFFDNTDDFVQEASEYPMFDMLTKISPEAAGLLKGTLALGQRKNERRLDSLFKARVGLDEHGQRQWGIESYAFTYNTVTPKGEPIVLGGRVTFPNNTVAGVDHEVSTLSLYGHMQLNAPSWAASQTITTMCLRAMLNSAVIEPDFMGCGVDSVHSHPGLAARTLSIEMIDCAMAALEIMRRHGVRLADDGYTTNWAISLCAIVSLGTARYYEMEASEEVRRALRLRSTYVSEGPIDPVSNILYAADDTTFNTPLDQYFSKFESMYVRENYDYDVADFCADWMLNTMIPVGDTFYSYIDYRIKRLGRNSQQYRPQGYVSKSPAWNFSPDMLNADGSYNMNSPKTKTFLGVFENETRWDSWTPATNVYMGHCKVDDFQPYGTARRCFESFHRRAPQTTHWYEIPDPGGGAILDAISASQGYAGAGAGMVKHYIVSAANMIYILNVENPEDMVRYYPMTD